VAESGYRPSRRIVVPAADTPAGVLEARELAAGGGPVVLVGADGARLGALAARLRETHNLQVAVYIGDEGDDALTEMITELFAGA
jgi:short-subunit dehydrogenase